MHCYSLQPLKRYLPKDMEDIDHSESIVVSFVHDQVSLVREQVLEYKAKSAAFNIG